MGRALPQWGFAVAPVWIMLALASGHSHALVIRNEVRIDATLGGKTDDISDNGPASLAREFQNQSSNGAWTVRGTADASSLGLSALAQVTATGMRAGGQISSKARAIFEDVLFEGPSTSVATALNTHLSGEMTPFDGDPTNEFSSSQALVHIAILVRDGDTNQQYGAASGRLIVDSAIWSQFPGTIIGSELRIREHTGLLRAVTLPDFPMFLELELNSGAFEVPTGVPLDLDLQVQVVATSGDGGTAISTDALVDFSTTWSFPTLGPVFDLPPGFTVNSAEAGIADNRWVPEPSGAATLLAAGLLATAGSRRRAASSW